MAGINSYYLLVCFGAVLFCVGAVKFLGIPFYKLAVSTVKQLDILLDHSLSENEKDKRILRNLLSVLKQLFLTLLLLVVVLIASAVPAFLYVRYLSDVQADTSSVFFYGSMFLGSFSLLFFKTKGDYSYWSKLLHTLVLDNYNLGKYLFSRETSKSTDIQKQPFVIVTGLARAGTTALTKLLYDTSAFHSITYANVPFLLAPNLWRKIYRSSNNTQKERSHGDNLLISQNSIEALEEYFFKVFLNDSYIKADHLVKHEVSADVLSKYFMYQNLFKDEEDTIYLAKNNNFLLRYERMYPLNPLLNVVLIFRNPLDQAKSLLRQHTNFQKQQAEDVFVLNYMNWLGHYEFGYNQKYFDFGYERIWESHAPDTLSYWLGIWINYYSYVLEILDTHEKLYLVHYEELLKHPDRLKIALSKTLNVRIKEGATTSFTAKKYSSNHLPDVDSHLMKSANELYHILLTKKMIITT